MGNLKKLGDLVQIAGIFFVGIGLFFFTLLITQYIAPLYIINFIPTFLIAIITGWFVSTMLGLINKGKLIPVLLFSLILCLIFIRVNEYFSDISCFLESPCVDLYTYGDWIKDVALIFLGILIVSQIRLWQEKRKM